MTKERKIILAIVDGASDKKLLGARFQELFKKEGFEVRTRFFWREKTRNGKRLGQDITGFVTRDASGKELPQKEWATEGNIESRFSEVLMGIKAEKENIELDDIAEIVHVIDTDGRFIIENSDVELIVEKNQEDLQGAKKTVYFPDHIECTNPWFIRKRNKREARMALWLLSKRSLCLTDDEIGQSREVPYRIFYMSCNLDHVFHRVQNLDDDKKGLKASQAAKRFRGKPQEFLEYLKHPDLALGVSYQDSWVQIQKGTNSLKRHTNLGLLFSEEERKERQDLLNK